MSKSVTKPKPKPETKRKEYFPFEVAVVCSQGPADVLQKCALRALKHFRIPSEKITIFSRGGALEENRIPSGLCRSVVQCKKDMPLQTCIFEHYVPGTPVVQVKDSLVGLVEYEPHSKSHCKPVQSLLEVIKCGFAECMKSGARLWGVSPEPAALHAKVGTNLGFISSNVCGYFNPKGKEIPIIVDEGSDYNMSIEFFKTDGSVVILNMFSAVLAGPQAVLSPAAAGKLWRKYPDFVVVQPKKGGEVSVTLEDLERAAA